MSHILVFAEFKNGKVKAGTLELLTAAQTSGRSIKALALGAGAKAVAAELAQHGAEDVYISEAAELGSYNPESYTQVVTEAIQQINPECVIASGTMLARDLFPRVAARLKCGIASDCTELKWSGSDVTVKKPMYAGKAIANVSFQNSSIKFILMRSNQLPIGQPKSGAQPKITELKSQFKDLRTLVKEVIQGASSKLDLTEANVIVSGGRGMKGPEHFQILHALAEVLGATVGASRAVVDAGWVPHSMQVGQTGKTVAPTLYIACGISGQIQHMAGMSSSKVIVAINKDPEAPIFKKATYGLVGDVFEIVPILTEEFKKVLQH